MATTSPRWMEPASRQGPFQPFTTSNYFAPGHRLRIEVSAAPSTFDRTNTVGNNYDEVTGARAQTSSLEGSIRHMSPSACQPNQSQSEVVSRQHSREWSRQSHRESESTSQSGVFGCPEITVSAELEHARDMFVCIGFWPPRHRCPIHRLPDARLRRRRTAFGLPGSRWQVRAPIPMQYGRAVRSKITRSGRGERPIPRPLTRVTRRVRPIIKTGISMPTPRGRRRGSRPARVLHPRAHQASARLYARYGVTTA